MCLTYVSQYLPTVVFCMQTAGGDDPAHGVSVAGAMHVGSGRVKLNKDDVCVVGCAIEKNHGPSYQPSQCAGPCWTENWPLLQFHRQGRRFPCSR